MSENRGASPEGDATVAEPRRRAEPAGPPPAAPGSGTAGPLTAASGTPSSYVRTRPPASPSSTSSSERFGHQAAAYRSVEPSADATLIRRTLAEIEPVADDATAYFYALLFTQYPQLRSMFPPAMDAQRDRLFGALLAAAERYDDGDRFAQYLSDLGRGHRKFGTQSAHYPAVGECLMSALAQFAVRSWGPETEAAWVRAYTAISQTMIDAAAADELTAPAWWQAEVVSHEMRTPDVAVLTVRPHQPYPFVAGQYASIETPWWPRVWRTYSFACSPRSDGLLSFHVKAVPAGWVSGALVRRAGPGDLLRIGPPCGSMTIDHSSPAGLLCLGGSTGIAPLKAMVEEIAEYGQRRPVQLFFGARRDTDLYDLAALRALERSHPWLSVKPVVADSVGGSPGRTLPEAVRQLGPWNGYDGYLSGPAEMVRSGVSALLSSGIPEDRIRHDFVGLRT